MEAHKTEASGFFLTDEGTGQQFTLIDGAVLGRTQGELRFPLDIRMSGRHARITINGSEVFIEDLKSRNGIVVNSKRIEAEKPIQIYPGDMIAIGNTTFCVGRFSGTPTGASLREENTGTAVLPHVAEKKKQKPLSAVPKVEKDNDIVFSDKVAGKAEQFFSQLKEKVAPTGATAPQRVIEDAEESLIADYPAVTLMMVALVLGYGILAVKSSNTLHPSTVDLLKWGANYAPRTTNGEWWRIIASTFAHSSSLHMFIHLLLVWQAGTIVTKLGGDLAFLGIAFLSQTITSCAGIYLQPNVVFVGANYASIGLFSAAFLLTIRNSEIREQYSRGVLILGASILISANLGTGLQNLTDMYLFLCAFGTGAILSLFMVPADGAQYLPAWLKFGRPLLVSAIFSFGVYYAFPFIPQAVDHNAAVAQIIDSAIPLLKEHDQLRIKIQKKEIAADEGVRKIQTEQLPKLRAMEKQLVAIGTLPDQHGLALKDLLAGVRWWIQAWEKYIDAVNGNDAHALKRATEIEKQGFTAFASATTRFSSLTKSSHAETKP